MRENPTQKIEKYRVRTGPAGSDSSYGANGIFLIPGPRREILTVVASDASGWDGQKLGPIRWEHVSVSTPVRCPRWQEMDFIKDIFWGENETVIQFHVPKSDHINVHPYTLHMWKPIGVEIPRPPGDAVG